ncbi:MAG: serine/threonine-protein kinase [Deltaproteobacteria bacterium]|nr:serine/threonine-protein kinase [Deltaproteobacteria bacterium]
MATAEELQPGTQLGRYRLERELGRGAMGVVFLAADTILQQRVCLKMLHPQLMGNSEAIARFTREIVLARRIAHHGVSRVYDLHDEGGIRFLSMEYVEGTPLRELVGKDAEPVPVMQALRITRNVCLALAAAHDVGVIHRDLKPRNIMLRSPQTATEPDDICLLDFGIATAADAVSQMLTQPGVALGTRHYIAPEVWAGEAATARSDLFSVGVLLFNLLVARMPWPTRAIAGQLERMMAAPAPPPSSWRPGLPREVDALVARALAVDPAARFANAAAFAAACDALLEQLDPPTMRVPAPVSGITLVTPEPPLASAPDASFETMPTSAMNPRVDSVTDSDSASWVVDGRAVDLPARPKVMPTAEVSGTELVIRTVSVDDELAAVLPRRGPFVAAGLIALLVAALGTLWITRDDDPAPVIATTTTTPEPTPEPTPPAIPEPTPEPTPITPPTTTTTRRPSNTGKAAATQAQRDLRAAMDTRGIVAGDDAELDRLRSTAAQRLRGRRYAAALEVLDDAIGRAAAVRVDKAFVQRKLTRFNTRFDGVTDATLRARLDDVAGRASLDFAGGRYDAANKTLNVGFGLLNKDR